MKSNKVTKVILTLAFFFSVSGMFANPDNPNEIPDDSSAPLNAPIGDYIIPMLLLGMATAFVLLRKKKVQNV